MKKLTILLLLTLTFTICKASDKEIIATIVFENTTDQSFNSGEFYSYGTDQKIPISTLESFKITLPEKGKYIFSFYSADFETYTFYPVTINERKNTIKIKLFEKVTKKELVSTASGFSRPINNTKNLSNEQFEELILAGKVYFVAHGLDSSIPEEYVAFQKKYGISIKKENCVLDPLTFKETTENNQAIANYLTQKYGDSWLLDLTSKPFGIK